MRNMGRLEPSAVPPLAAALESPDPAVGGRRGHRAGAIGDRSGRAVPDVPGGRADVEPGAAIGRAGGDRAADRPPVRERSRSRRSACWPTRPGRITAPGSSSPTSRSSSGRGTTPQGAGPAPGDAGRGAKRPSACTSPGRPCGWTRTIDRPRSRSSAWRWSRPPSGSAPRRSRAGAGHLRRGDRRRARRPRARCSRRPSPTASRTWPPPRSSALATGDRPRRPGGRSGRPHPLVRALTAPGRRAQFAAARALVELAPDRPFPGSSLVARRSPGSSSTRPAAPRRGHRRQRQPRGRLVGLVPDGPGLHGRGRARRRATASSPPPSRPTSS